MDGKDACLALLRDILITGSQAALIERAVVVIIPIYNVDGHERFGAYNRINQNGPGQTGWRTTARSLDLNRDYLKADAPETRAFLRLWNKWLPDYFVDNHVTDGADYQYDTTYLLSTGPDVFLALNDWQRNVVAPHLERSVTEMGHLISPFAYFNDPSDSAKGMFTPGNMPRFSTGYAILQNRPSMLVEMHMLKDYKTRVTGNYEILRALLQVINRDADLLTKMNREADAATIAAGRIHNATAWLPLWTSAISSTVPFRFRGYKTKRSLSEISGAIRIEYTKEPLEITIPWQNKLEATRTVSPPRAYIVPAQWTQVVEVLEAHGLQVLRTARQWLAEVEAYRCSHPKWQEKPYEGRHQLVWPRVGGPNGASEPACILVREKMSFPAGSAVVPLDQRAAKVAVHFLEPEAPDSAVAWGFFDAVFEQKEYAESYILEGLSREMLDKDPHLREEFEKRLTVDHEFASNPAARLNFFYQRSPWWDSRIGLYPVARLTTLEGVPLARVSRLRPCCHPHLMDLARFCTKKLNRVVPGIDTR
jgi:hypothetical protein